MKGNYGRWVHDGILILLVLACFLFTAHLVNESQHKFCDVIGAFVSVPVGQPANPKANPSREKNYEWYLRFVSLDHSLGCKQGRTR